MKKRRCLIPADGFYEWKKIGPKKKQPYNIGMADDGLFAFAGLCDRWKDETGKVIESCTILTTDANTLLKDIHDRMPVIIEKDDYDLWLDPGVADPAQAGWPDEAVRFTSDAGLSGQLDSRQREE